MTDRNKLKDRARDELFSHINRCGVLHAAEEDQKVWMEETMEYLGERYPDLGESDLKDLFTLGMRFCQPALRNGRPTPPSDEAPEADEVVASADEGEAVGAGAGDLAES
jgi:hypothetical protein